MIKAVTSGNADRGLIRVPWIAAFLPHGGTVVLRGCSAVSEWFVLAGVDRC